MLYIFGKLMSCKNQIWWLFKQNSVKIYPCPLKNLKNEENLQNLAKCNYFKTQVSMDMGTVKLDMNESRVLLFVPSLHLISGTWGIFFICTWFSSIRHNHHWQIIYLIQKSLYLYIPNFINISISIQVLNESPFEKKT